MNGVIIIDKPRDFTSFDVVAVVRKITGQRKIGHCGTLDPNAQGVLPLLLGHATKAQDLITNHNKEYVAGFQLGKTTDTLDIWGTVTRVTPSAVSRQKLEQALEQFRGDIMQVPPMYSAVQKDGRRLYDLARQGIEVERQPRQVTVFKLELLDFDEDTQQGCIQVACSKGTYIRSIIDDMGRALGVGGVMTSLVRTAACGYTLQDAITLEQAKAYCEAGTMAQKLKPADSLFTQYDKVKISPMQSKRFANGGKLDVSRLSVKDDTENGTVFRVYSNENTFLGLGSIRREPDGNPQLAVHKLFAVQT